MTAQLVEAADQILSQKASPERVKVLETIAQGWVENLKVRIRHRSLKGKKTRDYVVSPYLIEPSPWSDGVYLIGHSDVHDGVATFKVERIERATLTTEQYTVPEDFDEGALLEHAWGIWSKAGEPTVVRLKFSPGIAARRVRESVWHPTEQVTDTEDGGCIWEAQVAEWREMVPWVRGWGADCEVLEPEALQNTLKREAQRLARLYNISIADEVKEEYYAHSKDDIDEYGWQKLKDHLIATGDLAFALGHDASVSELARVAGLLHDIGKYSQPFQNRLRGSKQRVDHASAGAKEIVKIFPDPPHKAFAELISYCIAGHHTGLPDYGSKSDVGTEGTLLARREKKELKDYSAFKTEISADMLQFQPLHIKPVRFRYNEKECQYPGFSAAFLTRMVFSTLVDADWLETERYMQDEEKPRSQYASIETLTQQFNHYLQRFENPQTAINRKRTETLQAGLDEADHKPGFFALTVPTGGGKTFTSMAFALNHARAHGLKRIIYVIPFTSIIEQNAEEFRKALGPLGQENVLEHHSNFDWDGLRQTSDDETKAVQGKLKLAAENWDIPIVVTTNVQFFESLFASKKSRARKLHNITKSVIIFDEVQMLPREYLMPSLLAVQELVQNYGASAVFCTATQPSLQRFLPNETQFTELAPNPQELFDFYRRVQVKNLGTLTDEALLDKLNGHKQVLCIVNTRRHAKGLFDGLAGERCFHLSTLMCPAHRKTTLEEIRERLKNGQTCRVVSTQVMEAGIDIDFQVGYRALAGLDSIIQAAGRVNREMEQPSGNMFVFDPKTEFIKRTPIFIKQTASVTESTLRDFGDDPTAIAAIEAYYKMLYTLQDERNFDARGIMGYFDKGTNALDFDFKTAAENFKLIDENTVAVIIPYNKEAKRLVDELKYTHYPISTLRKLQLYTVNIYEREFQALQSKGVIQTIVDTYQMLDEHSMESYYHSKTGLILPKSRGGEEIFFD